MPTGSHRYDTCSKELSCWSLFELCSKISQNRLHPAFLKSDFTSFSSLFLKHKSSLSSQWIIEPNSCQRHGSIWQHIHQPRGKNLIPGKHPAAAHYSHWSLQNGDRIFCEWKIITQTSFFLTQKIWRPNTAVSNFMQVTPHIKENNSSHNSRTVANTENAFLRLPLLHPGMYFTVTTEQSLSTQQVAASKQLFIAEWGMIISPVQGPR